MVCTYFMPFSKKFTKAQLRKTQILPFGQNFKAIFVPGLVVAATFIEKIRKRTR